MDERGTGITLGLLHERSTLAASLPADLGFLSDSERLRAADFGNVRRREQFLRARWLARCMLAARLGGTPRDWSLSAAASEGPRILSSLPSPLFLSLSHSGGWVGCALAPVPVGLDLETAERPRRIGELARKVCTPGEIAELEMLSGTAQQQAFYRMWTLKEAWFKRAGTGIQLEGMRALKTSLQPSAAAANAATFAQPGLQVAVCADAVEPLTLFAEAATLQRTGWWHCALS